jgi:hypothetical protein
MPANEIQTLLVARFPAVHVSACLKHYQAMLEEYQQSSWEGCILKAGKFVEAVLKALWIYAGQALPPARDFKVSVIITRLANLPTGTLPDAIRLTIPRACQFAYDIASNRGARHDPSEVDPNEIDAAASVGICSWTIAEMIRNAQGGSTYSDKVMSVISGLAQKKYPLIEEVDGRIYFHLAKPSARKVGLLRLWYSHPKRVSGEEILSTIKRHHFSEANARLALSRLRPLVDEDSTGLRLLKPGVSEAESLVNADLKISR